MRILFLRCYTLRKGRIIQWQVMKSTVESMKTKNISTESIKDRLISMKSE